MLLSAKRPSYYPVARTGNSAPAPGATLVSVEKNIRIFIADESRMSCQLMAAAFGRSGFSFTVVEYAHDSAGVRAGLDTHDVDVVVISASLKDGSGAGFNVAREIRAKRPKTDVVMLLDSNDQHTVTDAFHAGASGVLSRDSSFEVLCKCIEAVSQGQVWANSRELRFVLHALVQNRPVSSGFSKIAKPSTTLTRREEGVVHLVAEGLTNRDISRQLNLSEHTVRNYLFRIYNKLGTSNRLELALYAIQRRKGDQPERQ
jgi:two-component system nitrate/nitrite response regulator NarL